MHDRQGVKLLYSRVDLAALNDDRRALWEPCEFRSVRQRFGSSGGHWGEEGRLVYDDCDAPTFASEPATIPERKASITVDRSGVRQLTVQ